MGNGLFGSATLDVVIGVLFVYLLLAIICTNVNEWFAGMLNARARTLGAAIRQMLDSQSGTSDTGNANWFLQKFYKHPLISGMMPPGKQNPHPSYIPARSFALAVMDTVTAHKPGMITFSDLETGINNLPAGDVKTALLALLQNAQGDLAQAQKNIESWFDDTMERTSGWYRRKMQLWTVIVATVLTLGVNADTLRIARTLWVDPTLRAELVEQAKQSTNVNQPAVATEAPPKASQNNVNSLGRVIGWSQTELPKTTPGWLDLILGWSLSIVAISLGAPFWFDVLNKFMRIRNSGNSPEESSKPPEKPQAPPADKKP